MVGETGASNTFPHVAFQHIEPGEGDCHGSSVGVVVGENTLGGGDKVGALLCGQTDDICLSLELKAGFSTSPFGCSPF